MSGKEPPPAREKAPDRAARLLIEGILGGVYPSGSELPGERQLCKDLGVARPALREAFKRLSGEGWLDIQHGRATRVRDYLREGSLSLLPGLLSVNPALLAGILPDLLEMWSLLAPAYTARAIQREPRTIALLLEGFAGLDDRSEPYARAMWRLHRTLIDAGGNGVYGLILNSFADFYRPLAELYYENADRRARARDLWATLRGAIARREPHTAGRALSAYLDLARQEWPLLATGLQDSDTWDALYAES